MDSSLIAGQKDGMGYLLRLNHIGKILWQISLGVARFESITLSHILYELMPLSNNDYLAVGSTFVDPGTSNHMYWAIRFSETLMPIFLIGSNIIILYILGGVTIFFGVLILFAFILYKRKTNQ